MVTLRTLIQIDSDSLIQHLNNPKVTQYLTSRIPQPYSASDAEWWINTGSKLGITKVIDVNEEFVGIIGANPGEHENCRSAELGYWLGERHWGKGICTKAIALMTDHVFASADITRLHARVFGPNHASMRALEKCGYVQEGLFKKAIFKNGQYYDDHVYAILRS